MIGFLLAGGMPLFDSVVHAFATAGTGGFSIKNASIAAHGSHYLQTVIAVFMVLFGVNFNVFYLILCGRASQALRSEELRTYLGIIFGATFLIALNIQPQFSSLGDAFHHSFFQVSSIMTTTGFSTVDFNLHHPLESAQGGNAAHAAPAHRKGRVYGRQAARQPCHPRRVRLHDWVYRRMSAFFPLYFH